MNQSQLSALYAAETVWNREWFAREERTLDEPNPGSLAELFRACPEVAQNYFKNLSAVDQFIAIHFYLLGMTERQIGNLVSGSQYFASLRIRRILDKIQLTLKAPSQDPIIVRADIDSLIEDENARSVMYLYFFNGSLLRVCQILSNTQSVTLKLFREAIIELGRIAAAEEDDRRFIARGYLSYLMLLRSNVMILSQRCKLNDRKRKEGLIRGPKIGKGD
jgi:hypothetical protein